MVAGAGRGPDVVPRIGADNDGAASLDGTVLSPRYYPSPCRLST